MAKKSSSSKSTLLVEDIPRLAYVGTKRDSTYVDNKNNKIQNDPRIKAYFETIWLPRLKRENNISSSQELELRRAFHDIQNTTETTSRTNWADKGLASSNGIKWVTNSKGYMGRSMGWHEIEHYLRLQVMGKWGGTLYSLDLLGRTKVNPVAVAQPGESFQQVAKNYAARLAQNNLQAGSGFSPKESALLDKGQQEYDTYSFGSSTKNSVGVSNDLRRRRFEKGSINSQEAYSVWEAYHNKYGKDASLEELDKFIQGLSNEDVANIMALNSSGYTSLLNGELTRYELKFGKGHTRTSESGKVYRTPVNYNAKKQSWMHVASTDPSENTTYFPNGIMPTQEDKPQMARNGTKFTTKQNKIYF